MATSVDVSHRRLLDLPCGSLPRRLRVLHVAARQQAHCWLAEAFRTDSATEIELEEATGMASGLAQLRDEVFDTVLICHDPPGFDALELVDAIRAGSSEDQAVIVLGKQGEQEMAALCFEAGAEAYVCLQTCTTRALLWIVARATERRRLIAENRRLQRAQRHRSELEQEEAQRLLRQQRGLVGGAIRSNHHRTSESVREPLSPELIEHYHELLKAYVMMGSGHLGEELRLLVDLHLASGAPARDALQLHLEVLEEMIDGLGNRSARHIMNRADVLILDLMLQLCESYRQRYLEHLHPPRQKWLPGFA